MTKLLIAGLIFTISTVSQAQRSVAPQVAERLKTPLKQTKVMDCEEAVHEVPWGSTRLTYTVEGLHLDGLQSSGAVWQTIVPASNALKCEVWSANLQKGAKPSLLIFKAPEMGGVEGGELTVLSFDDRGRPFPWKATGGFTSTAEGITQVTTDPATGSAQILVPVREGDPHAESAEVISLFLWQNGGFSKVVGADSSGAKWPVISGSEGALTGTERLRTSSLSRSDVTSATSMVDVSANVKVVKRGDFSEAEPLLLSNGQRLKFPAMLVFDRADGSRVIFLDEHVVDGVDEAIRLGATVAVRGTKCESEECRPFVMVARLF